jgi:Uncharacterised nucleotidyltransferase
MIIDIDPALLALAGAGLPNGPPVTRRGWSFRLDEVFDHGLAGFLAWAYEEDLIDLDERGATRLQERLESEAIRAVQLEGELMRLAPLLAELPAVALKGAILARGAYPDPILRPFTDLDLLVLGSRQSDAVAALEQYGYVRTRPEPAPGYDARVGKALTLSHPGGVVVDLHRTLVPGILGDGIDVSELLADRRALALGGLPVPGPSWEAHLVEVALHAVIGDGLSRALSIRDVAQVALLPTLDADRAVALATRWKVREPLGQALRVVADGLRAQLPAPLARLASESPVDSPAAPTEARSARSRLDELKHGDLRRRLTVTRSLVAPSPAFLRWSYGDRPAAELYGRRWLTLYRRASDARLPGAPPPGTGSPGSESPGSPPVIESSGEDASPSAPPRPARPSGAAGPAPAAPPVLPPLATVKVSRPAGPDSALWGSVPRTTSRQQRWSAARPPRPEPPTEAEPAPEPAPSVDAGAVVSASAAADGGGSVTSAGDGNGRVNRNGHVNGNGNGHGARNGNGNGAGPPHDGPPANGAGAGSEPTPAPAIGDATEGLNAPPEETGVRFFSGGMAALLVCAFITRLGFPHAGVVLVPLAGMLFALAASRRIKRCYPDEAWVGRWLVLGVAVKLAASYVRYLTLIIGYEGQGDASGYDHWGRDLVLNWTGHGTAFSAARQLDDLRRTNFIRWFTGVVYLFFGSNMVTGFFVFGLLALVGSYLWYRATVDAVPFIDKRLYLGLVMFAPSIAFWPSSIGKEALMQLGIGAMALATAYLLRQKLLAAILLGVAGGWWLWVVRPHLLAMVTVAAAVAYFMGRVRGGNKGPDAKFMASRTIGLIIVAFFVIFTVSQGAEFLGIKELSLTSVEQQLDDQSARSAQGGSHFDNGGDYLSPINLPRGAATVLLRPFPWETDSPFQLLASLESALLAGLIVIRLSSLRSSLTNARTTPFLMYCWVLTVLYAATFASFANFGLLVRQRSLVLPALFVLLSVNPVLERAQARRREPGAPDPPAVEPVASTRAPS